MNRLFRDRYGFDRLNLILILFAFLFIFSRYLWILAVLFGLLAIYRAMSKNFVRRQKELRNFEIFLSKVGDFTDRLFKPVMSLIWRTKSRNQNKKTHKYIKCRYCSKKLRVPRHKGKIKVTCPECKNQFIVKT